MMSPSKKQFGFSLVELSIVLLIIGVVFVGFLTGIGSFQHSNNIKESQSNLSNIKKQVLNFGVINKYLPCPDTDTIRDGLENRTSVSTSLGTFERCTASVGGVPYLDLGLQESDAEDGWSNPIRYAVNTDTTNANLICNKTSSASMFCNSGSAMGVFWFTLTDTPPFASDRGAGNYYICNENAASCSGTPSPADLESDTASVVLVAYNQDGALTLGACGATTGANNENCDTDLYYHQETLTIEDSVFFDDVITSISGYEVKAKLASSVVAWNSYTPTTPVSGLTPTVEIFDITQAEIDAGNVPTSNNNSPDVILVNRNVTTGLNLQNGDDYIAIGNNLDAGTGVLEADDGDDTVYIVGSAYSDVDLGNGDDTFVLGKDLTNALDAGNGKDKVWIQGDIASGSSFTMGDGDDILWLGLSNDSATGDIEQAIDGGADYDILVLENVAQWSDLSGSEQSNIQNFELIIFSDDGSGNRNYCLVGSC